MAFPTETVYGLGGHAFDLEAVAGIFAAKERPEFDPLIVHVAEFDQIGQLAVEMPDRARRLGERFWPGPLTLVLDKQPEVPDLVTAGLSTVAVRIPDHAVTLELLRLAAVPMAGPSANRFGRLSPTTAEHVAEQLGDRIDLILDGGPCRVGIESTVVRVTDDAAWLLRPGGVPVEEIESVIGPVRVPEATSDPTVAQHAPGMLPTHYAPRARVVIADHVADWLRRSGESITAGRWGLLAFREPPPSTLRPFQRVEVLSREGNLTQAAAGFFAKVRVLDAEGLDVILAERFPDRGLGRALNDRLERAAATAE